MMIATGGLLRINARRQDSLRSKPHKPHPPKKKIKNKRRNEVVVVKGKLKVCSVSGLVAVLGILVLLVGVLMAALGYWPRDGLFSIIQPQEGTSMALMSSSIPTSAPTDIKKEVSEGEEPERDQGNSRQGKEGNKGESTLLNQTETINGTTPQLPQGFLKEFLDRYLYSDRLKVFGPLIMGIGIFLFICANAVLHENRDRKTKVINLQDIYSTVIDLHSIRKPHPLSSGSAHPPSDSPLNGLVNYVQSKSLDSKPWKCPLLLSRESTSNRQGSDGGGGAVFSIYQEQQELPPLSSSNRHSLPQTFTPSWFSNQKEVLSSFTLPRPRQRSLDPRRRHSFWARTSREEEEEEEEQRKDKGPPVMCTFTTPRHRSSKAMLLLSSSSLSSLSHPPSSSSSTPAPLSRRRSLPTAAFKVTYSKLTHDREKSLECSSSHQVTSEEVTSQKKCINRQKLRMMSHQGSGVRKEEEEVPNHHVTL